VLSTLDFPFPSVILVWHLLFTFDIFTVCCCGPRNICVNYATLSLPVVMVMMTSLYELKVNRVLGIFRSVGIVFWPSLLWCLVISASVYH